MMTLYDYALYTVLSCISKTLDIKMTEQEMKTADAVFEEELTTMLLGTFSPEEIEEILGMPVGMMPESSLEKFLQQYAKMAGYRACVITASGRGMLAKKTA